MKSLVGNFLPKRPALGALSSLMVVILMGSGSSWASDESQSDNATLQGKCELSDQQQAMLSLVNEARSQARQCGDQRFEAAESLAWSCQLEAAAKSRGFGVALLNLLDTNARQSSLGAHESLTGCLLSHHS